MVDTCYFCKEPLGGTYTFYWDNRCHFRCLPETPEQKIINSQRDRITALEAKLAERVKVRPLEWKELSTGWIAHTSFHAYEVVKTDRGFMATYANRDFAWGTEDAMKAAAQADFDRRILSALEATPPAPKVTEAMVKAGRAHYSEGGCMGLDEHEVLEVVEAIIHAALTAAQEAGKP